MSVFTGEILTEIGLRDITKWVPVPGTIKVKRGLAAEVVEFPDGELEIRHLVTPGNVSGMGVTDDEAILYQITKELDIEEIPSLSDREQVSALRERASQIAGIRSQRQRTRRESVAFGLYTVTGRGEGNNPGSLRVPMTQLTFGNWIGTSREIVNKELAVLKDKGILETETAIVLAPGKREALPCRFRIPLARA